MISSHSLALSLSLTECVFCGLCSLSFSPKTSRYLAVSSDKGTIHIFKVKKDGNFKNGKSAKKAKSQGDVLSAQENEQKMDSGLDAKKKSKNTTSSLGLFKSVLPRYFSSEWSFAQFRVPDVRTIVAFGADEASIVVVSSDGTFYKATFDPKNGGDCQKVKDERFLKSNDFKPDWPFANSKSNQQ